MEQEQTDRGEEIIATESTLAAMRKRSHYEDDVVDIFIAEANDTDEEACPHCGARTTFELLPAYDENNGAGTGFLFAEAHDCRSCGYLYVLEIVEKI